MMTLFSLEFLVAVLFIIDAFFFILLFLFVKRVNRLTRRDGDGGAGTDSDFHTAMAQGAETSAAHAANAAAEDVRGRLIPLVEASRDTATEFDRLIREKKKISKALNDALDSKIISINLLLSRADVLLKKLENHQTMPSPGPYLSPERGDTVLDQQSRIIELYYRKMDIDTIAAQLSIPKGEVQLVIDLKEKCVAMETSQ